jgi:hypothetical protein
LNDLNFLILFIAQSGLNVKTGGDAGKRPAGKSSNPE